MTPHTCHSPYCWLLSCATCAACDACAETLSTLSTRDPVRIVNDPEVSAEDPARLAVTVLGVSIESEEAAAQLEEASAKVRGRLRTRLGEGGAP